MWDTRMCDVPHTSTTYGAPSEDGEKEDLEDAGTLSTRTGTGEILSTGDVSPSSVGSVAFSLPEAIASEDSAIESTIPPPPMINGITIPGIIPNISNISKIPPVVPLVPTIPSIGNAYMVVRACRALKFGDEITDIYTNVLDAWYERNTTLSDTYGFECIDFRSRYEHELYGGSDGRGDAVFERMERRVGKLVDSGVGGEDDFEKLSGLLLEIMRMGAGKLVGWLVEKGQERSLEGKETIPSNNPKLNKRLARGIVEEFEQGTATTLSEDDLVHLTDLNRIATTIVDENKIRVFSSENDSGSTEGQHEQHRLESLHLLLTLALSPFARTIESIARASAKYYPNPLFTPVTLRCWLLHEKIVASVVPLSDRHTTAVNEVLMWEMMKGSGSETLEKAVLSCMDVFKRTYCGDANADDEKTREEVFTVWEVFSRKRFSAELRGKVREVYVDRCVGF